MTTPRVDRSGFMCPSVQAEWHPYWELRMYGPEIVQYHLGFDPRIKVIAGTRDEAIEISTGEYLLDLQGEMPPDSLCRIVTTRHLDHLIRKDPTFY